MKKCRSVCVLGTDFRDDLWLQEVFEVESIENFGQ